MLRRVSLLLAGLGLAAAGFAWSADGVAPAPGAPAARAAAPPPADPCAVPGLETAAGANRVSLSAMSHAPFGRAEKGWEIYAPRIAADLGVGCEPHSAGFASALADWQAANGLPADGVMSPAVLMRMKQAWQDERPYVALRAGGVCPDAPAEAALVRLTPEEGYKGKAIQLAPEAAAAYRAMVAAARAEVPEIAADPDALDIFSGFRSPAYDDARCARDGNCGGITRAKCSAHRTGLTFDLVVGSAPGHSVDSTNDENRLHMTRTPAYRWLVANAGRFGFVNYVFEPWHWEYVGPGGTSAAHTASIR